MIQLDSPRHIQLATALEDLLQNGAGAKWSALLRHDPTKLLDPSIFLLDWERFVATDPPLRGRFKTADEWLIGAASWAEEQRDPGAFLSHAGRALYEIWEHLQSMIVDLLRVARSNPRLEFPRSGYVSVFSAGLSKFILVEYRFDEQMPIIQIKTIHDNPKAFFDVRDITGNTAAAVDSDIKASLNSGHKILVHRGVLTHVDRRTDHQVFGPSVDTMVVAEILGQNLFEGDASNIKTALEIGCGNGLISCFIATHARGLAHAVAFDNHFESVSCTDRNLRVASRRLRAEERPTFHLIHGDFQHDLITRKFDLIVCNPPYLPLPPNIPESKTRTPDYFSAVGGLSLLRYVLEYGPKMLESGGRLLLITSSLSIEDALASVPSDCSIARPLGGEGYEALFDVEAAINNKEWLSYLLAEKGLVERAGRYYHSLHALWITRKTEGGTGA